MKRLAVIMALGLPFVATARQATQESKGDAAGAYNTAAQVASSKTTVASDQPQADTRPGAELSSDQATNTPPQAKKPQPTGSGETPPTRPKIGGSMVGYIDDAIVGSQVRVRFEAGFQDDFPDLAEFFYAKCGCYKGLPASNYAYDPNAPGPGPGVVTDLNFQQLYFYGEYAPTQRFSLFVEAPLRWIQPQSFVPGFGSFPNQGGLGDVRAGFKLAVLASANHYLTFQLQSYFPSGNASKGLGTDHYSAEPAVLYYQKLSQRLALEAQVGDWHPIGGSAGVPITNSEGFAGDVFFYGIGPSYKLYDSKRFGFAPVIELVGWRVLSGFETVWVSGTDIANPVDGTDIVNVKIGARITFGDHNSIYVGYGRALTDADWYKQIVRMEYRYSF
jgi:hypothetical protein